MSKGLDDDVAIFEFINTLSKMEYDCQDVSPVKQTILLHRHAMRLRNEEMSLTSEDMRWRSHCSEQTMYKQVLDPCFFCTGLDILARCKDESRTVEMTGSFFFRCADSSGQDLVGALQSQSRSAGWRGSISMLQEVPTMLW